ncbi:MAG: tetratricopeptide repeat protein [candidate division Zixibacteria bacterium]|nr:tetratricopeptide repeat protein [candidate division Zixibacteria bacterium]
MKINRSSFAFPFAVLLATVSVAATAQALPSGKKSPEENANEATRAYNLGVEHQQRADNLLARSDSAKAAKEFKVALKQYDKTVKLNPDFPEAWNNLGYCRRNLGDYTRALAAYDQALKLKPDFPEAMEYRGVALVRLGRMDEAMVQYNQLKALDSTQAAELLEAIRKSPGAKSIQSAQTPQR